MGLLGIFFSSLIIAASNSSYEDALTSFHDKKFSETIIHLKNSLQKDIDHIPSRILLAKTLIAQGKGEMAETELFDLQDKGVDINQLVTLFAKAFLLQDKYERALDIANSGYRGKDIESEILFLRGKAYLGLNQTRSADTAFTDALNLSPGYQMAKLGKAQVAIAQNSLGMAMRYIEDALSSYEPNVNAWILKSVVAQMQGNFELALASINKALKISPTHMQARLNRATLLIAKTDFKAAAKDLDYVLDEIPAEPRAKYLRAVVNVAQGDDAASEQNMNEVMVTLSAVPPEVMKNNPSYFYLAGITNYQSGNLDEARHYFQSFLSSKEKDLNTMRFLALIELKQNDYVSAKNILSKANLYFPEQSSILTLLGVTMLEIGNNEVAQRYFEQVVKLNPQESRAMQNLARSKMASGNYEEAISNLMSAQNIENTTNNNVDIKLLLLESYLQSKNHKSALKITSQLIGDFPENSFYNQKHAIALGFSGNEQAAATYFQKAIELDANNIEALVHLARIDVINDRKGDGLKKIQQALLMNPENIALTIELADIHRLNGDIDKSHQLYEKAFSYNSKSQAALKKLITSYVSTQRIDKAVEVITSYINKNPQDFEIRLILGKLYLNLNQPHKAIASFKATANSARDRVPAYLLLSKAYLMIEDRSSAIKSLNKAIAWDDERIEPLLALFPITLKQKDYIRAEQVIFAIEKLATDRAIVDVFSAHLAMQKSEFSLAESHYKSALAKGKNKNSMLGLFHALNAQKKYKQAQTIILKWLDENPNDVVAEIALAESYGLMADSNKVLEIYQGLIKKYNGMPILLNNAANIAYDLGNIETALLYAKDAYQKAPKNINILDTLAWIESREGNRKRALSLFRDALVVDFNNPEVKYHLALTLEQENRRKEAQKLLIEIVNSEREFAEKAQAETLLKKWLSID